MSRPIPGRLLDALQATLGSAGLLTDPADVAPYLTDWRGAYGGAAPAILRPANTAEVAEAMRLCHGERVAVVPQGGNTGLCGGAVPDGSGHQLVLSLGRLRAIRGIDPVDDTITMEAGVVLHDVQEAATPPDGCSRSPWGRRAAARWVATWQPTPEGPVSSATA